MEKKQAQKIAITTPDGKPFKIPVEGSLGLLALGYKGVIAWRQVRRQYQKAREANKQQTENNQTDN
ncbi:MAG: hypothetical protein IPL12_02780 [Bacteroidetes bacterium]|nr:hypothetical protein [Bacteroidota bacterium]